MAEKLQLRSTSEPAKRAKRASLEDRAPPGPSPALRQFPGAKAAQMIRLAMMSKIAKASMVSAQQKQQQVAADHAEAQPADPPKRAKRGRPPKAKHAQQAQRDKSQQEQRSSSEVVWESAALPSAVATQPPQDASPKKIEEAAPGNPGLFGTGPKVRLKQGKSPPFPHMQTVQYPLVPVYGLLPILQHVCYIVLAHGLNQHLFVVHAALHPPFVIPQAFPCTH